MVERRKRDLPPGATVTRAGGPAQIIGGPAGCLGSFDHFVSAAEQRQRA